MAASTHAEESNSTQQTFRIGTRRSHLALVQTDEVIKALRAAWPNASHRYEVCPMSSTADNNQQTALYKFNEKALWTQELEVELAEGRIDFIVHSLKDMPTQLPHGLELGCVTSRADARDALVVKTGSEGKYRNLAELPEGAVVGTSSLRRIALLKRHYPHLKFADVRGNIGTRLAKLDNPDGKFDAIVIAVAGLVRIGMGNRITQYLSKNDGGMLHAVGQGALGIETRSDDQRVEALLKVISCQRSTRQALVERSLLRTLEGGCSVPIGVETEWLPRSTFMPERSGVGIQPPDNFDKPVDVETSTIADHAAQPEQSNEDDDSDEMLMRAIVVSLEGDDAAEVEVRKIIHANEDAEQFGWDVARLLVEKGADKILEKITLDRGIIKDQDGA